MTEPIVTCPKCGTEIKLTESLAAPIIATTRKHYERLMGEKDNLFTLTQYHTFHTLTNFFNPHFSQT